MSVVARIIYEIMVRDSMKTGETFNLGSYDIQERDLTIQNPKNGRTGEVLYVPRKLLIRLTDYVKDNDFGVLLRQQFPDMLRSQL